MELHVLQGNKVETPITQVLEEMLAEAREGKYRSVIIIGMVADKPQDANFRWSGEHPGLHHVGALEALKQMIVNGFKVNHQGR